MISVTIIGAGPTGLTAALELARRGAKVRIFDRREGPSPLSRAVGITQASIDLLTPCGAGPAIRDEAVRFGGLRMHRGAEEVLRLPLNFDDRSVIYGLPQDRTEAHLIAALDALGVKVEYNRNLTNYHLRADHIAADFGQYIHVESRYLIGADGAHSRVRATAGIHFKGHDLPGHWSIADVIAPDWPHGTEFAGYLLSHGDIVVVVPMAPGRYRLVSSRADALAALPVPIYVAQLLRQDQFTIQVRQAEHYRKGSVFLAGDAAHVHSPVGGRGMNIGIADACDLAERLMSGTQDGYETARHAAGAHWISVSERARRMLMSKGAAKMAMLAAMHAVSHSPAAQQGIVHQILAD